MSKLMQFLTEHPVDNITQKVIVSARLADYPFTIRAFTGAELDEYTAQGMYDSECSDAKQQTNFLLKCCIEPNFNDAEAIKAAGCQTPKELLNKTLKAGEQRMLYVMIHQLSGFGDFCKVVDEAKN